VAPEKWSAVVPESDEDPRKLNGGAASPARPPGYPADLERDVRVRSGAVLHLRPILPADAARLVAFHSRLTAQTVYLRFFNFHPVLSGQEVERFTRVDYVHRMALVVLDGELLVGVGRYDRLVGTDVAEVAFIVDDEYQQQGVGTLLLDELARSARGRGIAVFVADTLPENRAMLEMFHSADFPVRSVFEGGVVKVRFPIACCPVYDEGLARREVIRRLRAPGEGPAC
jgi:GNAT superfamily N-acetyltransferase